MSSDLLDDDMAFALADLLLGPPPSPAETLPEIIKPNPIIIEATPSLAPVDIEVIPDPPPEAAPAPIEDDGSNTSAWHRATLFLIVGIGLVLRVVNLDAVGLNSDEAVYAGQGGALLGVSDLDQHFSIFRAHPLLLQFVSGSVFHITGPSDHAIRLVVAVLFGLGSVIGTYRLASLLYDRTTGLAAAALLAVLPYHVIISRQVLVDVPMAFFAILGVTAAVKAVKLDDRRQLYLAFFWCALAAISKEIAVLLVPMLAAWLITGPAKVKIRRLIGPGLLFSVIAIPFPLTRLVNQPGNASQFFLWQFTRDPNHSPDYFGRVILQFSGWAFLSLLLVGVVILAKRRSGPDQLVLWWLALFGLFFQFWPTKLFPYLYLILPAMAIAAVLGARKLVDRLTHLLRMKAVRPSRSLGMVVGALVVSLIVSSGGIVLAGPAAELEGFGDFDIEVQTFAGSREFSEWASDNTPDNSRFVTIGPSLGNILRFYGRRDSVALSVSPDPAKRNPAYIPIANPDLAMRQMSVHYIVWDAYSADRSAFYNSRLREFARKLGGEIVFSVYADGERIVSVAGPAPEGADVRIVVWDVPGAGTTTGGTRQEGIS